jgi:hypothetical protein
MDDCIPVMAMVNDIGAILTNDKKWSYLSGLRS